ncbi:MAG: DUF308 domain-containing protein [Planctomycetota bacterium]|nr:MAG: DUF308 domain-containing protein [Planctomycetota bacterium]
MTESTANPSPASPSPPARWWQRRPPADGQESVPFTFTDGGCRTEVRIGLLLMLAAVFLWLWLGPTMSARLYLLGCPLLIVGIPLQAWQSRTASRPGYPLKIGIILTVGGLLMWPDVLYRETVDGALGVQPMAPLLLLPGLWILAWAWFARPRPDQEGA